MYANNTQCVYFRELNPATDLCLPEQSHQLDCPIGKKEVKDLPNL